MRSGGNDILRAPFEDDSIPLSIRQKKIVDIINHNISVLIVNSDYSYLRNIEIGISANIMVKIRGGVDYDLIKTCQTNKKERRKKFDEIYNTSNKKINTIACRMVDFKGIPSFLDFYKHLNREQYFLLLIGDGKLSELIKQKLNDCLLSHEYAFLGERSHKETIEYITISDAVINPSIYSQRYFGNESYIHTETMGRTMIEACAAGVPIIATDVGGTHELFVENTQIGVLVDSWNELCNAYDYVFSGKNWKADLDYSWSTLFNKYKNLFEDNLKHLC